MVSWITFAWQIEIIAVAILIYALIIFLRAIIKLDKEFRIALLLVLGSVIINVALGIMMGVFLTSGFDQEKLLGLWIIRPIVTLVVAILIMFGARKFFLALEKNKES
ncbi:hypothetical protein KAT24_02420 [Candidatus Pacearchaeota archaeon]|nr:hypothetical protein [Candidatus Pacearchaeota archaeon]